MIRVAVIDDNGLARLAFRHLFGAADGVELTEVVAEVGELTRRADVVVVSIDAIDPSVVVVLAAPGTRVLATSVHRSPSNLLRYLRAGARGFVWKEEPGNFIPAVQAVVDGDYPMYPSITTDLFLQALRGTPHRRVADQPLTAREQQVLDQITEGRSNKEISVALGITVRTVKAHISNILEKLGVEDRTQAAAMVAGQTAGR